MTEEATCPDLEVGVSGNISDMKVVEFIGGNDVVETEITVQVGVKSADVIESEQVQVQCQVVSEEVGPTDCVPGEEQIDSAKSIIAEIESEAMIVVTEEELAEKFKANTLTSPPSEPLENEPDTAELEIMEEAGPYYWPFDWGTSFDPVLFAKTGKQEFSTSNFLKGCKWAPDGCCLLTNADDSKLRIFNFPSNVSDIQDWNSITSESAQVDESWSSALSVKEGGTVYDYSWYPLASSLQPSTSCFLSTSKDAPVHLWDAMFGTLRATYLAYNYADEPIAAYSAAFDSNGEYIYCGYKKCIRIFNTGRPGRECTILHLNKSPLPDLNLNSIISCIAFNPAWSNVYALGTYGKTIGLYMEDGTIFCSLDKHVGGVTSMVFSRDGTKLYTGARADSKLFCWDLRNPGVEFKVYERVVDTQQRISFELTSDDRYLISGGTDGVVRVWDTTKENAEPYRLLVSNGGVNGVSLNAYVPVLATATGRRNIAQVKEDSSDEEMFDLNPPKLDNDVRLWKV